MEQHLVGNPLVQAPLEHQFFVRKNQAQKQIVHQASKQPAAPRGERLLCIGCHQPVTRTSERGEQDGRHLHTFTNPHGFSFEIGCFNAAPGAVAVDQPTAEHSWFVGCRWQIAYCRACNLHLGWRFSGMASFFGLIINRLLPEPPP